MSYLETDNIANIEYNHINLQVFNLLEDLDTAGQTSSPRGLITKEANLATLDIDPKYCIMNFDNRKFNYKYFAGELGWYLKADTSIDYINNFSSFWKNICPSGHANSNYGSLLLRDHPSTTHLKDVDGYPMPRVNQLEWVYDSLVKDKNTRQAVAFFNSPYFQSSDNKDFVCTMYVNFWIRKDCLDMKVQMRSNDIFFGLTYDAPWFSSLQQSMYLNLKNVYPNLKLGMYYHCADNIHYYERHFDMAEKIMDTPLSDSIKLELKYPLFKFIETEIHGKHRIYLSQQAIDYGKKLDILIAAGNLSNDKLFWKTILSDLYEITGDHTPIPN